VNLIRLAVVAQVVLAANWTTAWAGEADELVLPRIVVGQSNEACRAIAKVVRATKNEDFWSGRWRDRFGRVEWMQGSYPTMTAEGRHADVPYKYSNVDIDNDGQRDVVVVYTALFSSADWDWLYLFRPKQFRVAQKEGIVGKLFQEVPILNPRNAVQFSNGQSGVPVELHLWRYKGANFILLKEHFFAKKEPDVPSSFFVAKLEPQSTKWDEVFKVHRLVPQLTCRMVAK
jgi:hypothetical protein